MKSFDVKAAQQGAGIRTKSGQPAEFVGLARSASEGPRVFAVVAGHVLTYMDDGRLASGDIDGSLSLIMAPRVLFMNILDDGCAEYFPTREQAMEASGNYKRSAFLAIAHPVELPE